MTFLRILAALRRTCTSSLSCFGSLARAPANRVFLAFVESTCSGFVLSGGLVSAHQGYCPKSVALGMVCIADNRVK